jgi:hypothetical protein
LTLDLYNAVFVGHSLTYSLVRSANNTLLQPQYGVEGMHHKPS